MVRMIPRIYRKNKWRIVLFWVLASLCMLIGSMIAGQLQETIGTSDTGFLVAFIIALMFFMVAVLLLVAIVLAFKVVEEE